MTLLDLPSHLRARYSRAKPDQKTKIEIRIQIIAALDRTPQNGWKAKAKELSAEIARVHAIGGFSPKRILDIYREYRANGQEALLMHYGKKAEKPKEFVQELARRVENNKRVASVALDELRADWFAGKNVPGYGNWRNAWRAAYPDDAEPAHCPDWFTPKGWSERNLSRLVPSEAELEYARRGVFAAHGKLPQKRNDYRSLMPLQIVVFDDVRCDWLVSYPGATEACEMWLLVAMDAATRKVLDWISLARVPNDEGKRAEFIGEHMLILAGNILRHHGVPTGWQMTLKVENAKATISREKADYLGTMAGGKIVVDYTVMHNRRLPSGHTERHGTPWDIKGILESFFRTFHDHTAGYIGNTGPRYDLAPAELKSRQDDLKALLKEAEDLPADVIAQLRLPFLTYEEAVEAVTRVMDHLNNRSQHSLQGFDKIQRFRFPKDHDWRSIDELKRYPQEIIRTAIIQTRLETPAQRFDKLMRHAPAFVHVPEEALIPLMARTVKRVRHPHPFTIEWSTGDIVWTYRGEKIPELNGKRAGKDFFVRFLPANVDAAWLYCVESGRQLGVMQRVGIPLIGDQEAQMAAVGEVVHARSLVTGPVDARHAPERAQRDQDNELNAAIIAAARAGTTMVKQADQATKTTRKQSAAQEARREKLAADLAAAARERQQAPVDVEAPTSGGLYEE
jgi:hypothetical protein